MNPTGHWYDDAIFYSIYPLGAVNGKRENDYVQTTEGLERLGDWVEHMAGIGCNAVYFAPVFESKTHGYDTTDYRKIDSRLGTNRQFAELVQRCHDGGIRVVVDGVFNHTGRDFFAFRDLVENREWSPYRDWYRGVDFGGNTPAGDGFGYEAWRGHFDLPRLNPHCPAVRDYLFDTVRMWVKEFDIDGIRLDCADCLDFGFMKELRSLCVSLKPDFWLMGEIIHGDYNRWANADTLHSVTNYECAKGLHSSHNDGNLHEIAHSLNRQSGGGGIYRNLNLYTFADNHDLNRLADTVARPQFLPTIYTLLYTMPGTPSVYYGSEWGIRGVTDRTTDWALRPQVDIRTARRENPALTAHITALAKARKESTALRYGDYAQISVSSHQYAFRRSHGEEEAIVLINIADTPQSMEVPATGTALTDLLGGETFPLQGGRAIVPVPAHGSRILRPVAGGVDIPAPAAIRPEPRPVPASPAPPAPPPAPPQPEPSAGCTVARLDSLPKIHRAEHPVYEHTEGRLVDSPGCRVALYQLPPGKSAAPFHWHTGAEEVYHILSGQGLLRHAGGERNVTAGDLIHFPAGEAGGHRLINNHHQTLEYLCYRTAAPGDATVYPESGKVDLGGGKIHRLGEAADGPVEG